MSITTYNGSGLVAMKNEQCAIIVSDTRYGESLLTMGTKAQKIYQITSKCVVGLGGLITDCQTFSNKLKYEARMYKLIHERELSPKSVASVMQKLLYEKRFGPYFIDPLVAGVDDNGVTYIAGMDIIGSTECPDHFVASGTSADMITGIAESVAQHLEPDTPPKYVLEQAVEACRSGLNRDCIAGWGMRACLITKEAMTWHDFEMRMD